MDSELYFLKTNFYEDEKIEKTLCEKFVEKEWTMFSTFRECVEKLQENKNEIGISYPLLDKHFFNFIMEHISVIEDMFDRVTKTSTPYKMTYFGLQTLKTKYLLTTHDGIHESIDHLWLRISLFIHKSNWKLTERMFRDLREGNYIHATPTLFNAGLTHHQMASCFCKGTKVLTKFGYESIEKIKIGTEVWTHENMWKPVVQTHKNPLQFRKVYRISFEKGNNIYVTGNHPCRVYCPVKKVFVWKNIEDCTKHTLFQNPVVPPVHSNIMSLRSGLCYGGMVHLYNQFYQITLKRDSLSEFYEMIERGFGFGIMEKVEYDDHYLITMEKLENSNVFTFGLRDMVEYDPISFSYFLRGLQMVHVSNVSNRVHIRFGDVSCFEMLCSWFKVPIRLGGTFQEKWREISILDTSTLPTRYTPFLKLKSINRSFIFPRFVYTLGVKDHHSYTVAGNLVAKNCFLMGIQDSIEGIYKTLGDCAQISKFSGGIGLHCHSIRSNGSYIFGTNGRSNGIVPMLKVFNDTARYVDQGGGKRNGSIAIYLEPWHADIFDFLLLKKNIGSEETRARDLFYALWIPDYFMECVEKNEPWYLFDPSTAKQLNETYGTMFREYYQYYVTKKLYVKKVQARELWKELVRMQIETGTPYMLYKDQANRLSNQKNLGTIQSSNLCCEIIQYSSPEKKEISVCNLASISLPSCLTQNPNIKEMENVMVVTKPNCVFCDLTKYFLQENSVSFVEKHCDDYVSVSTTYPQIYVNSVFIGGFDSLWKEYLRPSFDFVQLEESVSKVVENLNIVMDKNKYPLEECKTSNEKHRPMGIGVQGLADVFMKMLEPYDSDYSRQLNRQIFEVMYFTAIKKSVSLAKQYGSYESFDGSPLQQGLFHFEMYDKPYPHPLHCDWNQLRESIQESGCRNSLFIALMPTASTSQLLGNTESFEPLTSNFYLRRTNVGEFIIINRFLQNILKGIGLWDKSMHENFILGKGSIQKISTIPSFLKSVFRTVWEIPQKHLLEMTSDRQRFIDQSQSMNIYLTNPSVETLTKIHFYGWKLGLKTGSYYIRTRSLTESQNFFLDAQRERDLQECENCSA